ncbi:2OG-Fe(II) oxygenase superfamily protein [Podospora appendiculata]|uniref:2OG-Fe(II) oxygenase superfamily protein n=1 Tax=Podospora appendiculata TaxID=314037 RepID=A0AAE1C9H3_9PEZI|nr:2OG-Fe(II) oxygenase superfamily protein [Podospora appendiculata]
MKPTLPLLSLTLLGLHVETQTQAASTSQAPIASPDSDSDFVCSHPPYKVHLVSTSPLIIYIKDFLTEAERAHLKKVRLVSSSQVAPGLESTNTTTTITSNHRVTNIPPLTAKSKNKFHPSAVADGTKSARRTSQSTYIPRDATVHCIETRALSFQGLSTPRTHLEPLQLVKYVPGEHYHQHTDWFASPAYTLASAGGNRASSFFTYVHVGNETTGGGTNFPLVDFPRDEMNAAGGPGRWCEVLDCDEPWERGITFRPVEGNAIYWQNLLTDGRGDPRTLHAGLPVTTGDKIGMNIWTRQAPLSEEVRGVDVYPDL